MNIYMYVCIYIYVYNDILYGLEGTLRKLLSVPDGLKLPQVQYIHCMLHTYISQPLHVLYTLYNICILCVCCTCIVYCINLVCVLYMYCISHTSFVCAVHILYVLGLQPEESMHALTRTPAAWSGMRVRTCRQYMYSTHKRCI